jgi:hypothetical protein
MTATEEAFAALDGVFGLAPEGGEHEEKSGSEHSFTTSLLLRRLDQT